MKISVSLKKRCKNCLIIKRGKILLVKCVTPKHKARQR